MKDFATLKYKMPMMHGPAVVRLQEMLDMLKFDGGPNDGIFGLSTQRMVGFFQLSAKLKIDGICGPKTWRSVLNECDKMTDEPVNVKNIVNRIGMHDRPKLYKKKRPWSQIRGVTLHQTGCEMPKNPAGWDRVNAHIGITQEGLVILLNDPKDFIWHAQGLSKNTIGIEIEGNYMGIGGEMKTLWKGGGGPHHLNSAMLDAAKKTRLWIHDSFKNAGRKCKRVYAHRQSKNTRIADPGEEIWKHIALPWERYFDTCISRLDSFGTGRPIPKEWDNYSNFEYRCKPGRK